MFDYQRVPGFSQNLWPLFNRGIDVFDVLIQWMNLCYDFFDRKAHIHRIRTTIPRVQSSIGAGAWTIWRSFHVWKVLVSPEPRCVKWRKLTSPAESPGVFTEVLPTFGDGTMVKSEWRSQSPGVLIVSLYPLRHWESSFFSATPREDTWHWHLGRRLKRLLCVMAVAMV